MLRTLLAMRRRGLLVAGYGAPGGETSVAATPPPSEDGLSILRTKSAADCPGRRRWPSNRWSVRQRPVPVKTGPALERRSRRVVRHRAEALAAS